MNWGNKLLMVFIVFAALMSYMVYRCVQTPVELVAKEYYRDELAYQQVIDGTRKANALSERVALRQDAENIIVQFPVEMKNSSVKGNILFYCAADAHRDRKLPLQLDEQARQTVHTKVLLPGKYTVKIEWENNHTVYYSEQDFIIL